MKILRRAGILILLSFGLMVLVNESQPAAGEEYVEAYCSRYCHSYGCLHFQMNKAESEFVNGLNDIYVANIHWLKHNPLGLSYVEMNILIYVILFPILFLLLCWGLFRKRRRKHA